MFRIADSGSKAQFYHISAERTLPITFCGGLKENFSIKRCVLVEACLSLLEEVCLCGMSFKVSFTQVLLRVTLSSLSVAGKI